MTDNEIKREQPSFEVRAESLKKRTKEFFSTYENPNGSEDRLEICLIREGYRAVLMAEKEINRQKAEIEKLEKGSLKETMTFNSKTIANIRAEAKKEFVEELIYKIVNTPTKFESTYYMYRDGIVFRQNEIIDIIKEMVGEVNA